MVNAKNAFLGTMLAGIIIAAVGAEKYYSGNWDTMSGDFVYAHKEAKFKTMTGRYYAENTNGCTISETGAATKGEECDMHKGVDYQIEMTNGEHEWFASNDVIVSTNLATGETATSKASNEGVEDDGNNDQWSVVDGKFTTQDGTTMEVSNPQSPGKKIRDMWGGFKCGFGFKCWVNYMWKKYTTCSGLFWAIIDSIVWCIGWIIYLFWAGTLTAGTLGAATPAFIAGLSGFSFHCVRGVLWFTVLLLIKCTIDAIIALWNLLSDSEQGCRQLRGSAPGGGNGRGRGRGAGNSSSPGGGPNPGCTSDQEDTEDSSSSSSIECRRFLSGWGGNGSSWNGKDKDGDCRMLNRGLSGWGGDGGNCNC